MIRRAPATAMLAATALVAVLLGGCSSSGTPRPAATSASPTASPAPSHSPAADLARLAAVAARASYTAVYTLRPTSKRLHRATLKVWRRHQSLRIDIVSGGGTSTLIITAHASYSCRSAKGDSTCFRVATGGKPVPRLFDAGLQRVFSSYVDQLSRHATAYSVQPAGTSPPLGKVPGGTCFTIRPLRHTPAPQAHAGRYCFADAGVVTSVTYGSGTLRLTGFRGAPPARVFRPYSSPTPIP